MAIFLLVISIISTLILSLFIGAFIYSTFMGAYFKKDIIICAIVTMLTAFAIFTIWMLYAHI